MLAVPLPEPPFPSRPPDEEHMDPQIDRVSAIIRDVAAAEVMPRFQRLAASDIAEKRDPQDLVTTADLEAERRLEAALTALAPGSVVVGEEGVESDPGRFAALAGGAPVWLVDPVDGTYNFANGKPCFAVIVALCLGGETEAAWIFDPVADAMVWAERGMGAWTDENGDVRPLAAARPRPVSAMAGSLGWRLGRRVRERAEAGEDAPARIVRLRCTGREYMDLADGRLDFAQYTRLKPWDHAAGVLIHAEAGGYNRLVGAGTPYQPTAGILDDTILLAPDAASWGRLRAVLS